MMDKTDIKILQHVADGDMFWSKREGGSEPYQKHKQRLHTLEKQGLVVEFSKSSCCMREYYLTSKGMEILKNERR